MIKKSDSDTISEVMQEGQGHSVAPKYNQKQIVKERLALQMKKGKRVFLVHRDLYVPQSTAVITVTKLYNNFALGYVLNKLNGTKIPYTINYYSLIANDYRIESAYEE